MEVVNGACFGLLFPAMMTFAYKIAPKGAETTVIALAFVAHAGIGEESFATVSGNKIKADTYIEYI